MIDLNDHDLECVSAGLMKKTATVSGSPGSSVVLRRNPT